MIDEAIATLNRLGYPIKIETMSLEEDRHIKKAIQLGIEALKAHKARREDPKGNWSYLLPGETEK